MGTPRTYKPKKHISLRTTSSSNPVSTSNQIRTPTPEHQPPSPKHIPEDGPWFTLFATHAIGTIYAFPTYAARPNTPLLEDIGFGIALTGIAFTFASQIHMKNYWRKDEKGQNINTLATTGGHALIRNPIYGGVRMANLGYVAANPTPIAMGLCMVVFASSEYLVAIEEKNCRTRFGNEYQDYAREVPRWLPKPSTLAEKTKEYITARPTLTNIVNGVTRTLC